MPKKDGMLDMFKPEYLNLHDLTGYIKAHLSDLINNTYSEQGIQRGKVWITELIQRLAEIQKQIPTAGQFGKGHHMTLSLSLSGPLHKAVVASGFTDRCELFSQLRRVIGRIRRILQEILKNPAGTKKRAQKIKLFCEILCQEMPYEDRFVPGPVVLEIKIPPSSRTNYMADGQPGEAD